MISTDKFLPLPESCPEAMISTDARTEPATAVLRRFMITYLNIKWLARILDGAEESTRHLSAMNLFLKSLSVTPCTYSNMSSTLKFVAAYVNVPSLMLYTYSKSRMRCKMRLVSFNVSSEISRPYGSRWLSSFCRLIKETSEDS